MQRTFKRLIAAVLLGSALAFGAVTIGQVVVRQPAPLVAGDNPGHGGSGGGGG